MLTVSLISANIYIHIEYIIRKTSLLLDNKYWIPEQKVTYLNRFPEASFANPSFPQSMLQICRWGKYSSQAATSLCNLHGTHGHNQASQSFLDPCNQSENGKISQGHNWAAERQN